VSTDADCIAQLTAEVGRYIESLHDQQAEIERERAAHERTKARVAELEHDAHGLISRADYLSKISSESWEEMKAERDAALARARFWKAGARHLYQLRQGDADGYFRDFHAANARVERWRAVKAETERDAALAEAAALVEHMRRNDYGMPPSGVGGALAARVPLLEQKARFNDIRQRAALALFDRGFIEAPHEDGCPQDDTCDCPLMPLAQAVVNDDERLQKIDAAAAEKALAALDEKGASDGD
jgi:hypothetical protein